MNDQVPTTPVSSLKVAQIFLSDNPDNKSTMYSFSYVNGGAKCVCYDMLTGNDRDFNPDDRVVPIDGVFPYIKVPQPIGEIEF